MSVADVKLGKNKILMFRLLEDDTEEAAAKLALQTNHQWSYSRSTESTSTKDGAVVSQGGLECTLSIDAVSSSDDVNATLMSAVLEGKKLEVWEVDLSDPQATANTYSGMYAQGNLESWEVPNEVDGLVTLTTTMRIDGVPKSGTVTLTAEQEAEVDYAFRDTQKVTSP